VAVPSAVLAAATGSPEAALTAAELVHRLEERGVGVELVAAPGATARLAGRPWAGAADLASDRTPGLLDAGPVVLAAGRTPRTAEERSARFFASIPRRVLAASALCRRGDGRLLVVFDLFRGAWTLPGGLVDVGESPLQAAVRESREEGGLVVAAGQLLGVFSHRHPDRLHLLYAAAPADDPVPDDPTPLHPHEIGEVRWVGAAEADALLDPGMRRKLHACLEQPGRTWHW
jgi:8-oxo-dGTP pyrophosphatase MutT (NUDIX family)